MEGAIQETRAEPETSLFESLLRRSLRRWGSLQAALLAVSAPFLASRLLIVLMTLGHALVRHTSPFLLWNQWDSKWYLGIAAHGYHWHLHHSVHNESSLAFFPLYPLLIHAGTSIGIRPILTALGVSNIAFAGALLYVYELLTAEWGQAAARRALWLLALFPTAFFTFAPYTEGLFLLCTAGALYHARREQPVRAGVWMAASVLTRSTGVLLIPTVLVLLRYRSWTARCSAFLPALCALSGYVVYLSLNNLPLSAVTQAQRGWHRGLTFPWTGFVASFTWFQHYPRFDPGMLVEDILCLMVTMVFLGLTVAAWPRLGTALRLYCGGFWLLILCTPEWQDAYFAPFSSVDRFVLALFPLAGWLSTQLSPRHFRLVLTSSAVVSLGAIGVHLGGGWIG